MTMGVYLVLGVVLIAVAYVGLQLLLAKTFAIQRKQKEVNLLGGLMKLIL